MTREEFLDYVSDRDNAERVSCSFDVAGMHIGIDAMLKECERCDKVTGRRDAEVMRFMMENDIPPNLCGYMHLGTTTERQARRAGELMLESYNRIHGT